MPRSNKEHLYLIVDGRRYDLDHLGPKQTVSDLIFHTMDVLQGPEACMCTVQGLIEVIREIRSLARETCPNKAEWSRVCTHAVKGLELVAASGDPDRAVQLRYEQLLRLEGLGTLPNFGVRGSIEKGVLSYNPEKRSTMREY